MDYHDSIKSGELAIKPLIDNIHTFYSPNALKFGLGKAGQGYASFHPVLNGITYGRITFYNGELYSIHHYKKDGYPFDKEYPGEILFLQIKHFLYKERILKYDEIQNVILDAERMREEGLTKARQYRELNPLPIDDRTGKPKRRKALKGRNIRNLIEKILFM